MGINNGTINQKKSEDSKSAFKVDLTDLNENSISNYEIKKIPPNGLKSFLANVGKVIGGVIGFFLIFTLIVTYYEYWFKNLKKYKQNKTFLNHYSQYQKK